MVCKHWRQEDYLCVQKEKTVNPDELRDCAETCPDYEPGREHESVICRDCYTRFPLKKANKIEVNNEEYPKCPECGAIAGLKRDDGKLSSRST